MTANQINYQKYLEDVRSHKASEQIARRQAKAAEAQAEVAAVNAVSNRMNAETNKSNLLLTESAVGAQWYGAQANAQYQQAMAEVSRQQAQEAQRHNEQQERNTLLVEGWKNVNQQESIQNQYELGWANVGKDLLLGGVKGLANFASALFGGKGSGAAGALSSLLGTGG